MPDVIGKTSNRDADRRRGRVDDREEPAPGNQPEPEFGANYWQNNCEFVDLPDNYQANGIKEEDRAPTCTFDFGLSPSIGLRPGTASTNRYFTPAN